MNNRNMINLKRRFYLNAGGDFGHLRQNFVGVCRAYQEGVFHLHDLSTQTQLSKRVPHKAPDIVSWDLVPLQPKQINDIIHKAYVLAARLDYYE